MKILLYLFFVINLTGCAANQQRTSNFPPDYSSTLLQKLKNGSQSSNRQKAKQPTTNTSTARQKLLSQYSQWKGTPYKYGGLSKRGVDCSGFVQITFKNQFAKFLPRTTRQQANIGKRIPKSQLQAGDLVFFQTSYKVQHVGISLGNSEFLHASTSKGVMISNLDNAYWHNVYRFSVRLQD
ncbi:MAG: NlpC/P60 family protein [Gammaproteobacteria bacterium]|nr:NlpC/P60 family protein [Gammaproteobacteria bacterium]MDH5630605.1 NlpC/P60 family protein [Gammaproteobacteria bacterium]